MLGHNLPAYDYGSAAARKLVECFKLSRKRGVHIERVMRRVTPFVEGRLSLVDCGGCGQQIVCAPDGRIGCCHAFLNDGSFFFQPDEVPNPQEHPLYVKKGAGGVTETTPLQKIQTSLSLIFSRIKERVLDLF